jgi:hypothetical protein
VAAALGQRSEQSFFRMQAQVQMEFAFKALHCAGLPVTLGDTYDFLSSDSQLAKSWRWSKRRTPARRELLVDHFQGNFLTQPAEQLGGVKTTIANYLKHFTEPDIAEIFCPKESTFSFDDIDRGQNHLRFHPATISGGTALHQYAAQADVLCSCAATFRQAGA